MSVTGATAIGQRAQSECLRARRVHSLRVLEGQGLHSDGCAGDNRRALGQGCPPAGRQGRSFLFNSCLPENPLLCDLRASQRVRTGTESQGSVSPALWHYRQEVSVMAVS